MFQYPDNSVILAPLSGYTDIPFRLSARRHGCRFAFAEMIDAGSIAYGQQKTLRYLERSPKEEWLGVQLIGADIPSLEKSAVFLDRYDFDVLDFNLGCPVRKVLKKGEGAALAKKVDVAAKALDVIVRNSRHRVTAKTRILDVSDPAPTIRLAKALEDAGAQVLTIHGRIMSQMYSGPVYCEIIAAVRAELKIQVIANGGVVDGASMAELKARTGCQSIMVARGAMGNPWLFDELSSPETFKAPTPEELAREIGLHAADIIECHGEGKGLRISRKIVLDYMKGRGYGGHLRLSASLISSRDDLERILSEIARGPAERYKSWLHSNPSAPRRLSVG